MEILNLPKKAKNANHGWPMLLAKLSLFIFYAIGITLTAHAAAVETCPPFIKKDGSTFSKFAVAPVELNGKVGTEAPLSLDPHKGKVTVVRLYGTWCPYCKKDLQVMNKRFTPLIKDNKLNVVMVSFKSRKETLETLELFMKSGAKELGIDTNNFIWVHSRLTSPEVKSFEYKKGEKVFAGMEGVPYGLVYDQKGQLRFQGHFTESDEKDASHYQMIESLASGKCS